jgi:A/G-specific adenine glycosylase
MASEKHDRRTRRLLGWYDGNRRKLPWRTERGAPDPYRVWLSEIMLQQTTVAAVAGYYEKFTARWPTVEALAASPQDDVLAAWAGLGYYARARNLHRAAGIVANEMGGRFPRTVEELAKLPGVGAYTAGAIAAIAFGARAAAMDANAERVIARLFAVTEPPPVAKAKLKALCLTLVPEDRPGDLAQSLMDLGATVCTAAGPACMVCPLTDDCAARKAGMTETLPVKAAKKPRPLRRTAAFVAVDEKGRVLLRKRPEKGLLGGMLEPPSGPWGEDFPSAAEAKREAPFPAKWRKVPGFVRHTFTHFVLEAQVYTVAAPDMPGMWRSVAEMKTAALPTVMRKIVAHGLQEVREVRETKKQHPPRR